MADDGVYRKTEKGRTEIATRANRLGLRERTLLIMVDDKTTRSGLMSRSAHPGAGAILDALLAEGYIEVDPGAAAMAAVAGQGAPATRQAPVEVSLSSAASFASHALVRYLGPSADNLTARVEKTRGAAELATLLEKCRHIIQDLAGKSKADEFWAGVSARLPPAERSAEAVSPAASSAPADSTHHQPAAVEVSLSSASRFACQALLTYLGPSADDLTAIVEKSTGAVELAIALEKSRRILQDVVGKKKADEFWAGVSARLPGA